MGNRSSRRNNGVNSSKADSSHAAAAAPVHSTSVDPDDHNKGISCPELSAGAVRYDDAVATSGSAARELNYTVYRSYSNVAEASRRPEPRPDIRVYRRNTAARYGRRVDAAAERSQTLPRGFGRSRSTMSGLQSTSAVPPSDTSSLPRERYNSTGGELKRQTALGLSVSAYMDPRTARRSGSTVSMTSIGYRVSADDMPDTGTIKRRLAQFETVFARALAKLYSSLPDSEQLSMLSLAVRPDRANQHVSLLQYLQSNDIPMDLLADGGCDVDGRSAYVLTIQPALFSGVMHVRRDCVDDPTAPTSLAGELVACLAAEAGAELARVFEYQIALLSDGLAIELLAGHAAHCVIDYIKSSGRTLDRNTILLGAVRGAHRLEKSSISPKLSVVIGQRELKWELGEILKRPGLRKELCLFTDDIEVNEGRAPWRFFTSYLHDPMLYGYRALIVEWDYLAAADCAAASGAVTTAYRLNGEDEASFPDEAEWRPDDFHRNYCPYRRLVGASVVEKFNAASTAAAEPGMNAEMRAVSSLAEFVRRLQGSAYSRDQIQPVYRPISVSSTTDDAAATDDDDEQHGYSRDDWYAMVDDRSGTQQPLLASEYITTSSVSVTVTPYAAMSNPLPVVPEVSVEDRQNGDDTDDEGDSASNPAAVNCHVNGDCHVTGNGDVETDGGVIETTKSSETTTVIMQTTIVGHVNGNAVNNDDVTDVAVNGSVVGIIHGTEQSDISIDAMAAPTSGYIIDEAHRRTIRSDL